MILPILFFSKLQNKAEFKNLDDSSDFPGLRTSAASMASTTSVASMTFIGWILAGNQMANTGPFVEWIVKNPNFH